MTDIDRPLQGTLEGFRDWAAGKGRGPRAGRHHNVLEAIDRYQMYLKAQNTNSLNAKETINEEPAFHHPE